MTAVMPRPANAPEPDSRPPRRETAAADLCHWVLSVQDWRVHALDEPCEMPWPDAVATRCQRWHLIACPVDIARRSEVCARCMAGGLQRLEEVLLDRTATEEARPW